MPTFEFSNSDNDPIIVFDDGAEEQTLEQSSIPIRRRQPSFSFLGPNPIPKGFFSLGEFVRLGHLIRLPITVA
jgi:hypothetical protein